MTPPIEGIGEITQENVSQKLAGITINEREIILQQLQKSEKIEAIVSDQIDEENSDSELKFKILTENNATKILALNIMKKNDMCTIDNLKKLIDIKFDSDSILFGDVKISKCDVAGGSGIIEGLTYYYNSNDVGLPGIELPSKKDFQKILSSLPTQSSWIRRENSGTSLFAIILGAGITGNLYNHNGKNILLNMDRGGFGFLRGSDCIIKFYEYGGDGLVFYEILDDSGVAGLNSYPGRSIIK